MAYFKQHREVKAASAAPADQARCQEDHRVIIRIWTSARHPEFPGQNVGHVSIATTQPQRYISLWPQAEPKQQANDFGVFKPVPHEFKQNLAADYSAEDRRPEITVCLYSLNSELLLDTWEKEKARLKGWTLIGHNWLINQNEGDSCSGLAYRLLTGCGIYDKLISRCRFSSTFSSVVTPDDLSIAVRAAKREELVLHPETAAFHHAGETPMTQPAESKSCIIL